MLIVAGGNPRPPALTDSPVNKKKTPAIPHHWINAT